MTDLSLCRSVLFTPGLRPERFGNAKIAGADAVLVDLEDAIALPNKSEARRRALPYFVSPAENDGIARCLRVNGLRTADGLRDLIAMLELGACPDAVFVPKCESAAELRMLDELLTGPLASIRFIPLIESARGLGAADDIANAGARVAGLMLGGVDLAADLGAALDWESLLFARARIVQAAASAGIVAIDVPYLALDDDDGLRRETEAVQRLGFGAKSAIHPKQVAIINAVFTPDAATVEQARRVVAASDESRGDVCVLDGRMIDRPVVRAAYRVLAIAARPPRPS